MPFLKGHTSKNNKIRHVNIYIPPAVSSFAFLSLQGTESKNIHIAKLQQKVICKLSYKEAFHLLKKPLNLAVLL